MNNNKLNGSSMRHTNPVEDLACNHFDSFLWDDFLMSSVMPGGRQGNTWFDLHQAKSERKKII